MGIISKEAIPEYSIIRIEEIKELKTIGYLLKHKKTGANIVLMENDDTNKVFNIGFRTPPQDDSGAAHIIEHSVLCGSKKYPAKNTFEELVQGSLNTFVNAMTYPDKTMYPVASCNKKDFRNLMDVYLDGVFNPKIYDRDVTFKQEGWHYELESKDGPLKYNGVVYNEMRGALSTPNYILDRAVKQELFPDTCYGNESGGKPSGILELSYDECLKFHKKYYHPSNSYIYLYGDLDMVEALEYLHREYLSKYDYKEIDSTIKHQEPFKEARMVEGAYSIGTDEESKDKGFLAYGIGTGSALDRETAYALKAISYGLLQAPEAPIKRALIEAGVGKVISGGYRDGQQQNLFSIMAQDVDNNKVSIFKEIIENKLIEAVDKGLDKDSLEASLNMMEFQYREGDFGSFPRGLFYCLYVMDCWLYDENEPFLYVNPGAIYDNLRKKIGTGYFENIVRDCLLNNSHKVIYSLKPQKGLNLENDRELEVKLSQYKATLSEEELEKIISDTVSLREYQSSPPTREELLSIPVLELEDIDREPMPLYMREENQQVKIIFSDIFSNGIAYTKMSFDCRYVPKSLIPYVGFLENILANMDTTNYKYGQLNNMINIHLGGFRAGTGVYNMDKEDGSYQLRFEVDIKALYSEIGFGIGIIKEVLLNTVVENEKRIREIIQENCTILRNTIMSSGHTTALGRGYSYISEAGMVSDMINGIGAYQFFSQLNKNFDYQEIVKNLKRTMECIFNKSNLIVSHTSDAEGLNILKEKLHLLTDSLSNKKLEATDERLTVTKKNEGIVIPSPVSYVARVGNYKKAGYKYTGVFLCLKKILNFNYLWKIRVEGGAYDVMNTCQINSGNIGYVSYRDPNVEKTDRVYLGIPEYLENFQADDREIRKYIIGAISSLDTPLNPKAKGYRDFAAYICGRTEKDFKRERDEVLALSVDKIRDTAKIIRQVLGQEYVCTVGNKDKILQAENLFQAVEEIFN